MARRRTHRSGWGRRTASPALLSLALSVALLGAASAAAAAAQASEPGAVPTFAALPIEEPITLDGRLDEPAWQRAEAATGFRQREPRELEPATERTEVRVLYTPAVLYVGVTAFDREPERIVALEMGRDVDVGHDDGVVVLLDTFHDHRNAYLFETNPNGSRTDALVTDEGRDVNFEWDGVWDAAAARGRRGVERRARDPAHHPALRPGPRHLGAPGAADRAAQERGGVLVADPPGVRPLPGLPGRAPHRPCGSRPGPQPPGQAVRNRHVHRGPGRPDPAGRRGSSGSTATRRTPGSTRSGASARASPSTSPTTRTSPRPRWTSSA